MSAKKHSEKRKRSRPITQKKSSTNLKILGVLIVIIIIIVATAIVLMGNDNQEKTSNGNPIAVFDTTIGNFKVELYMDKMPITCENFIKLVNDGFYDGMNFYRISDDFMIQAGRYFPDESEKFSPYSNINFEESDVKHVDGAISMASTGAGVGGSAEFFICDGTQSFLDGDYAAFGEDSFV